jgi:hypothetical protein
VRVSGKRTFHHYSYDRTGNKKTPPPLGESYPGQVDRL